MNNISSRRQATRQEKPEREGRQESKSRLEVTKRVLRLKKIRWKLLGGVLELAKSHKLGPSDFA